MGFGASADRSSSVKLWTGNGKECAGQGACSGLLPPLTRGNIEETNAGPSRRRRRASGPKPARSPSGPRRDRWRSDRPMPADQKAVTFAGLPPAARRKIGGPGRLGPQLCPDQTALPEQDSADQDGGRSVRCPLQTALGTRLGGPGRRTQRALCLPEIALRNKTRLTRGRTQRCSGRCKNRPGRPMRQRAPQTRVLIQSAKSPLRCVVR